MWSSVVGTVSRTARRIALLWWQLVDCVDVIRLVDVVDDRTIARWSSRRTRSQRQLTRLWTHAASGGLLVLSDLVRLVANHRTIAVPVQRGVALSVVNHRLWHMARLWVRNGRQLREVLTGVVAFVVLVGAAQRIRVVQRVGAVNGAGVAAGTSGRDLIGVGPHRGGHLGAWGRQDAIAQSDVLQLLVNGGAAGQSLMCAARCRQQLHIVVNGAIAFVDLRLALVVSTTGGVG